MKNKTAVSLMLFMGSVSLSANEAIVGDWRVVTTGFSMQGFDTTFDLTIENDGDGFVGYIFNGPVPVSIDGDSVEIVIDWVSGYDTAYLSRLLGTLSDGQLSGEFTHDGGLFFDGRVLREGRWTATPLAVAGADRQPPDLPPDPVDISGVWNGAFGRGGFSKYNYSTTARADAVRESFKDMDAPHIRCAGYGLVTVKRFGGSIFSLEIFQTDEQITLLYGGDYIRRIYLDDRPYPDNREITDMGFSKGEWRGSTLVVTTTHITPNFLRAGHGNPISGNAHTIEHYFLDDDGYLYADMWVHDPENYSRPPYMPGVLDKSFAANVITKTGCDPYSYFRQLDMEGELDELWSRSDFRR